MNSHLIDELLGVAAAIGRGETPPYQHNECFTAGAFDQLLVNVHGSEAFELLGRLCDRLNAGAIPEGDLSGYFQLLTQVAQQSDTTQMPAGLLPVINMHPEWSRELRHWYRV